MRLVIIGCEYSGTTTLGFRIRDWVHEELGGWVKNVHDHGKFPYTVTHEQEYTPVPSDFTVEEQEQLWALSTRSKETIMRHNVVYHASGMATMTGMRDSLMIGLHIEEAIYGELYLGFEGRRDFMSNMEDKILSGGTDAVLCHVTAGPEVIRQAHGRKPASQRHPQGPGRGARAPEIPGGVRTLPSHAQDRARHIRCHGRRDDTGLHPPDRPAPNGQRPRWNGSEGCGEAVVLIRPVG